MIYNKNTKRIGIFPILSAVVIFYSVCGLYGCDNMMNSGYPELILVDRTANSISVEWEPAPLAEYYYLAIFTDPDYYYNDFYLYDATCDTALGNTNDPAALGASVAASDDNIKEIIYFEPDETLEYTFNELNSNTTYYIEVIAPVTTSTVISLGHHYALQAVLGLDTLDVTTL